MWGGQRYPMIDQERDDRSREPERHLPWRPRSTRSPPTSSACRPSCPRWRPAASRSTSSSSATTSRSCSTPACASCIPLVSAAVASLVPLDDLRWISFGHVEADECGAMNQFLADAPKAEVVHGGLAVMVSLADLADRPPRAVEDGEVLDTRYAPPALHRHAARAPRVGERPLVRRDDQDAVQRRPVHPRRRRPCRHRRTTSSAPRSRPRRSSAARRCGPNLVPTLHALADLEPDTLAVMHGSSYRGDGATQLRALAAGYAASIAERA